MPHFVVETVTSALNVQRKAVNGSRVLLVGIACKRNIDDKEFIGGAAGHGP
jgi:UDP-N-acetyl-D-glucosamine dehydrogenase